MSAYTGQVPDTEPAGQWAKQGICIADPEAMYPGTLAAEIGRAKAVCRRCPVMEQCLQWALETREPWGVWGGTSEADRRAYFRRRGYHLKNIEDDVEEAAGPARTLQTLWAERTLAGDGHMAWTGSVPVSFQGRVYTPHRIGFELDRGRLPVGIVRASCGVGGCVLPAHLRDQVEREAARAARLELAS